MWTDLFKLKLRILAMINPLKSWARNLFHGLTVIHVEFLNTKGKEQRQGFWPGEPDPAATPSEVCSMAHSPHTVFIKHRRGCGSTVKFRAVLQTAVQIATVILKVTRNHAMRHLFSLLYPGFQNLFALRTICCISLVP